MIVARRPVRVRRCRGAHALARVSADRARRIEDGRHLGLLGRLGRLGRLTGRLRCGRPRRSLGRPAEWLLGLLGLLGAHRAWAKNGSGEYHRTTTPDAARCVSCGVVWPAGSVQVGASDAWWGMARPQMGARTGDGMCGPPATADSARGRETPACGTCAQRAVPGRARLPGRSGPAYGSQAREP